MASNSITEKHEHYLTNNREKIIMEITGKRSLTGSLLHLMNWMLPSIWAVLIMKPILTGKSRCWNRQQQTAPMEFFLPLPVLLPL